MSIPMQSTVIYRCFLRFSAALIFLLMLGSAHAGTADADVLKVIATNRGDSGWSFSVTVAHPDTGWSDYSDGWDVVTEDGTVLKRNDNDPFTRLLLHPHETEQPFTRSQSGIKVPEGTRHLTIRAHDLVDGFGGKEIRIDLKRRSGPGYEISQ